MVKALILVLFFGTPWADAGRLMPVRPPRPAPVEPDEPNSGPFRTPKPIVLPNPTVEEPKPAPRPKRIVAPVEESIPTLPPAKVGPSNPQALVPADARPRAWFNLSDRPGWQGYGPLNALGQCEAERFRYVGLPAQQQIRLIQPRTPPAQLNYYQAPAYCPPGSSS
jgi:hypothetical protein